MRRLAVLAAVGVAACTPVDANESFTAPMTTSPDATTLASAMVSLPIPTPEPAPVVQAEAPSPEPALERAVRERASRGTPRPPAAPRPARVRPSGDVWGALAACESGGNPAAHGGGGRYHGAFQFSLATWRSLGYGGDPHEHPYSVQLEAAQRLQARSGWGQWPRCARRLGLI